MELKEYLLNKSDSERFEIVYEFENRCPCCNRDVVTVDDEYSSGEYTVAEFRADVENKSGHYGGYTFVYEMDLKYDDITFEKEDGREVITVHICGEPECCEDCKHYIDIE